MVTVNTNKQFFFALACSYNYARRCNGRAFEFSINYLTLSCQHLPGADAEYIAILPEFRIDTRMAAVGFAQATTVTTFMN